MLRWSKNEACDAQVAKDQLCEYRGKNEAFDFLNGKDKIWKYRGKNAVCGSGHTKRSRKSSIVSDKLKIKYSEIS